MGLVQLIIVVFIAVCAFLFAKWITNILLKQRVERNPVKKDDYLLYDQQARHIKDSLESLYIKLEEYSKEVLSKLDTKILILHNLLIDADKKISVLQEKMKAIPEQNSNNQKEEVEEIHKRVCELYKNGLNAQEIAKQLKLQVSEVNLILALKNIQTKQQ